MLSKTNDSTRHDCIAKVNLFLTPANNHDVFFINKPSFLSTLPKIEDKPTRLDNVSEIRQNRKY